MVEDRANRRYATLGLALAVIVFLGGAFWYAERLRSQIARVPPDTPATSALLNLPLGMPEGSVRALLSLFVIVFGFVIVVFQNALGLKSAEAITGFIGAVIAFYFSSRTEQAVRETTEKAVAAQAKAEQATTAAADLRDQLGKAQDKLDQTARAADEAKITATAAVAMGQNPNPNVAAPGPVALTATSEPRARLEGVQGDLAKLQDVIEAVSTSATGPQMFAGIGDLLGEVKQGLAVISPLLAGSTDAGTLAKAADDMSALVQKVLPNAPVVSTILDTLSQVTAAFGGGSGSAASGGGASDIAAAIAKLAPMVGLGGPVGLVGGLLASGASLIVDQLRFDRLKAALTERPFDLELMRTDRLSDTAILQVLDFAPSMNVAVSDGDQRDQLAATALFRLLGASGSDAPPSAGALAAQWRADPPADLEKAIGTFDDAAALAGAIEEYRTGIIALNAIGALPPRLPAMSPDPDKADGELPTGELVGAVKIVRQIPGVADAIDKTVSLIEALRGIGDEAGGGLAGILKKGFDAARGLLPGVDRAVAESKMAENEAKRQADGELAEEVA